MKFDYMPRVLMNRVVRVFVRVFSPLFFSLHISSNISNRTETRLVRLPIQKKSRTDSNTRGS